MKASDFSDVFVSYRRTDVEFAQRLVAALEEADKEIWIDWEDIPPGSENFSDDIKRGLEGADAFIAILSPDYLQSPYTMDLELGYALELNKRIIPIVWKKLDGYDVPQSIGSINWIFFQPHAGHENTFEESFPKVVQALEQNLDHARDHKRYLLRAIEWKEDNRNSSRLLVGSEIDSAERWLSNSLGKDPAPTVLHRDYVTESRKFANKQQNRLLAGMASAVVVLLVLLIAAVFLGIDANTQRELAQQNLSDAVTARAEAVELEQLAREQANLAQAQSLAAQANVEFSNGNHARALLLAKTALEDYSYTVQAERALSDIFRLAPITADVSVDFFSENGWLSTADTGVRIDSTSDYRYLAELDLPRTLIETEDADGNIISNFEYTDAPDNLTLWSLTELEEVMSFPDTTRDFMWVNDAYLWIRSQDTAGILTASLWNLDSKELLFTVPGQVNGIHVLDDTEVLAIREADEVVEVEIYSVPDGELVRSYMLDGENAAGLRGDLNRFTNIRLSTNSNYLLWREDATLADREAQLVYRLHLSDGEMLVLEGRLSELKGNFLVSSLLIDIRDGVPLLESARSYARNNMLHVATREDGTSVAYFIFSDPVLPTEDSETPIDIQIYDLITGEVIAAISEVTALANWSPLGNYVILRRNDNRIMFSLEDGSRLFTLPRAGLEQFPSYSWSPDESLLVIENREVLNLEGRHLLDFSPADDVLWSDDGTQLTVFYNTETVVYDVPTLSPIGIFALTEGTTLLDISQSVNVLFPSTARERLSLDMMQYLPAQETFFFSGMVIEDTSNVRLNFLTYTREEGFKRDRLDMPLMPPPDDPDLPQFTETLAEFPEVERLSPDGTQLAISRTGYPLGEGGGDGFREVFGYQPRITLHDATTLEELLVIEGYEDVVVDLSWSPDGTRLAAADTRERVFVFDVTTGAIIYEFAASTTRNQFVRWSPDGRWLATGSGSQRALEQDDVLIWDMETGEQTYRFEGQTSWLVAVEWSPDSSELATLTASPDNTLRLWHMENGELITTHRLTLEPAGLAWAEDSSRNAIVDIEQRMWVLDAVSHEITHNMTLPEDSQIAWAGSTMITLSDGVIREFFMPVTPDELLAHVNACCVPRVFSETEMVRFFSQSLTDAENNSGDDAEDVRVIE